MSGIAVDVVLLPDERTTDWAIEMNMQLVRDGHAEITLHKDTCLPHVSLAMGCIQERDLDSVRRRLERLVQTAPVTQLTAVGISIFTNSRGEPTSLLDVEKTAALQTLHEAVMEEMAPFFRHNVTAAMLCSDAVAATTLEWIRDYRRKAGYEHFAPHITLGYGRVRTDASFPIPFHASRLAVCHLGNHCTCRTVLASVELPW